MSPMIGQTPSSAYHGGKRTIRLDVQQFQKEEGVKRVPKPPSQGLQHEPILGKMLISAWHGQPDA